MRANRAAHSVATVCRVLGVSTSGFYAWLNRPPSRREREDAALKELIRAIHRDSNGTYGRPRVHVELQVQGMRVSPKRVARLMREAGLEGVSRRPRTGTTKRSPARIGATRLW